MVKIGQLLERGFFGGIVIAAAFAWAGSCCMTGSSKFTATMLTAI